jgi:hypothetical protein
MQKDIDRIFSDLQDVVVTYIKSWVLNLDKNIAILINIDARADDFVYIV